MIKYVYTYPKPVKENNPYKVILYYDHSMHIPDGYLPPSVCVATWIIAMVYLYFVARKTPRQLFPRIASVAAGIFIAQMLNWPIPGGTSLHFVGGAFAAIYMGPWAASIALALVLAVQLIFFHDGGITTYGANVINMGIVDVWVGYLIWLLVLRSGLSTNTKVTLGGFLAGWLGLTAAGTMAGVEIGLWPTIGYPLSVTVPAMFIPHLLLGLVEGVITSAVLMALRKYGAWTPIPKAPEVVR